MHREKQGNCERKWGAQRKVLFEGMLGAGCTRKQSVGRILGLFISEIVPRFSRY
jgi:hypothetical protein